MTKLRVAIYDNPNAGPRRWTHAFAAGLARHGILASIISSAPQTETQIANDEHTPEVIDGADLHIFWSMRLPELIDFCRTNKQDFICLDHGYTEDRNHFKSVNLNGLNGRSELDVSAFTHDTSRCDQHSWAIAERKPGGEKVFLIGQVHDDKSLEGADLYHWLELKTAEMELLGRGADVLYKPHPRVKPAAAEMEAAVKAPKFEGSMEDAFKIARLFLTYSSTSGPAAWLGGIPALAASPVSMIYKWQLLENTSAMRQRWLNDISFRQFNEAEFSSGLAWDILAARILERNASSAMPSPARPDNDNNANDNAGPETGLAIA